MTDWDFSELDTYAEELTRAASRISPEVRAIIGRGALNIKNQLVREMGRSRHFGQIARAISYDIKGNAYYSEAQIGPVKGSPGSLANIAYFGSSRGGGTVPDPEEALKAEAPVVERYLADAVTKALS